MGDTDNSLAPSKKRVAGRELSRDNPGLDDEDESAEQETGTFKRASDEVLASRRIVKVRRHQSGSTTSTLSSNPFASIRLVPPTQSVTENTVPQEPGKIENQKENKEVVDMKESKVDEELSGTVTEASEAEKNDSVEASNLPEDTKGNTETRKDAIEDSSAKETTNVESGKKSEETSELKDSEKTNEESEKPKDCSERSEGSGEPEGNDKKSLEAGKRDGDKKSEEAGKNESSTPLSSFQQLSSSQNAFTGLVGTGFASSLFSFGSLTKDGSGFGVGSGSIFGVKNEGPSFSFGIGNPVNGNSTKTEGSGIPSMHEVRVETGEENENGVFTADASLFEFSDGWKERGKGEVKVNVSTVAPEKARLVMRTRGNYRLILNASLYADMKLTNMDKRGVSFACINSATEGKEGLSTFALKFKDATIVEEFRVTVMSHKGKKKTAVLQTPENSPKASDE